MYILETTYTEIELAEKQNILEPNACLCEYTGKGGGGGFTDGPSMSTWRAEIGGGKRSQP